MKIKKRNQKQQKEELTGAVTWTYEASRSATSGFLCERKLHAEAATFQGGGMHEGSNQQQANCESPHHVKMPLTIGATPSLVKRVALKGALAHSAHVVLHVHVKEGGGKGRERKRKEDTVEERKYKSRAGLNSDCGQN